MPSYEKGFRDGWRAAHMEFKQMQAGRSTYFGPETYPEESTLREMYEGVGPYKPTTLRSINRKQRKRPASKKEKLLKTMTNKKWKTYKGKKTWIQIRAQVSRSQAYKKKARRL
jgi:hypothetical protein